MNTKFTLAIISLCFGLCSAALSQQPNVLFISVDDLNDYVSILDGHPQAKTSNLDRLAAMGMNFTNAHATSASCTPSRTSLMTGLYPHTTGVQNNGDPFKKALETYGTLNKEFMNNDYYTAGTGKIHHLYYFAKDEWNDSKKNKGFPKVPEGNNITIGGVYDGSGYFADDLEPQTGDFLVAEWAAQKLNQTTEGPFFIACGIYRPHRQWSVPEKYFRMFLPEALADTPIEDITEQDLQHIEYPPFLKNDKDDVPKTGRNWADRADAHELISKAGHWKKGLWTYLACIAYADAQIGTVLDALENHPEKDNTIIVLWSDHGWHLGEKSHWAKYTLWEETTRVPFVVVAPGLTQPGSVCNQPVGLIDIYPTLRDLCSLNGTSALDGRTLRPLLSDPKDPNWEPFAITEYKNNSFAVRTDKFRYIRYNRNEEELYDHRVDPNEWNNIINSSEYKEDLKHLKSYIPKQYLKSN